MHKNGPVAFLPDDVLGIPAEAIEMTIANQSLCNTTARLMNCLNSNNQLKESFNPRRVKQIIDKFVVSEKFLLTQSEFEFIRPGFESLQINMSDCLGSSYVDEKIYFSKPLTAAEINEALDQYPQPLNTVKKTNICRPLPQPFNAKKPMPADNVNWCNSFSGLKIFNNRT